MQFSSGEITLTDAATIAINAALGTVFRVTLTASRNVGAPTNPAGNQVMILIVEQGGSGSYALTWNSAFSFSDDLPVPVLSTTVGKKDLLGFIYIVSVAKWRYIAEVKGF
jgi:hypothetical protein